MTCKTFIELPVECLFGFEGEDVVLKFVSVIRDDKSIGEEITASLSKHQRKSLIADCMKDWKKKLKDEE